MNMNDVTAIEAWKILSLIGTLLVVSEIFIPGFVVLPIGIGFLVTAIVALFTPHWVTLLAVLAAAEVATFWFFKSYLKKYHAKTRAYTNAEGMIGAECIVTETIPLGGSGYVKLYGDQWQAKTMVGKVLKVNSRVVIVKTEGNKVFVEPIA